MQLKGSQPLPDCCSDPAICTAVFMKSSEAMGSRVFNLANRHRIGGNGDTDYGKLCYIPEFDPKGDCHRIAHCGGTVAAVSRHTPITTEFSLDNNIVDMEACMEFEEAKHRLLKFFGELSAPHASKFTNKKGGHIQGLC